MKLDKVWTTYLLESYFLEEDPFTCDSLTNNAQLPKSFDLCSIVNYINPSKKLKTVFGENAYVNTAELYISILESLPLYLPYRAMWNKKDPDENIGEIHEVQGTMRVLELGEYVDVHPNERCYCCIANVEAKDRIKVYC